MRIALTVALATTVACSARAPVAPVTPAAEATVAIMAASRLTAGQLHDWFDRRVPRPGGVYAASVPVADLVRFFLEEGADEGVTGDIAFMQSVVETGWFRFAGTVPASSNNFAGIGATDTQPRPAVFPDARTGVRAQIQHLRAYADPTATSCTMPPLHHPCVDPRFDLVQPKGRAVTWNQMGNGNWASAPTYAGSILALYSEALAFHGVR